MLENSTKIFSTSQFTRFVLFALTKSVTKNIRDVTERHCLTKGIFPSKESDAKLLHSIYNTHIDHWLAKVTEAMDREKVNCFDVYDKDEF